MECIAKLIEVTKNEQSNYVQFDLKIARQSKQYYLDSKNNKRTSNFRC